MNSIVKTVHCQEVMKRNLCESIENIVIMRTLVIRMKLIFYIFSLMVLIVVISTKKIS